MKTTADIYSVNDLDGDVDPIKLLNRLYFEEDGLAQAALEQPTLMLAAIRYRIAMLRKKVHKQSSYDMAKSRKTLHIRKKLGDSRKVTEAVIAAHLNKDEELDILRRKKEKAELAEELAKGIIEAFKQRRDMIKTLTDLSRNNTARELWALEKVAKDKKLRETAFLLRSRARKVAYVDEDEDSD